MCDRGGRKLINLSSFLSGQGEIKMDTSTEKHNFPHSKLEKEEDILEQLCIWKTQNISLDLERICQHFRMEKRDIVVCLKRMQKEGYLEKLIAGQEIQLTDYGLSVGNDCIYRHNSISQMLQFIGVNEKTADQDACRIEHIVTDESTRAICQFINYENMYYERRIRNSELTDRYEKGNYIFSMQMYSLEQRCPRKLKKEYHCYSRNVILEITKKGYFKLQKVSSLGNKRLWYKNYDKQWVLAEQGAQGEQIPSRVFEFIIKPNDRVIEGKLLIAFMPENQTEPENAYVAYQNGQFVIVPETVGSKLNIKEAYKVLNAAVDAGQTSVNFSDTPEAYVNADVTQDDPALQSALEACNNYTKASITYTFGSQTTTLNGDTIKDWLQFDEKGQLIWDDNSFQQHVADYVAQLAATYDTVGTEREFQTTSGRTVYVSSSVYGWKIDQAAEAAQLSKEIQSGTQTTREPVYSQTANSYGVNDLGDTYIEVDLSEQHMYYYQNGSDIFESDFVSGNMSYADRQTHAGIFTLYYKKSPDVLRGTMKADGTYEYESEVQYWMPFDGGIGFHDASWRDEFGGDIYLTGGSHGCINLPPDNAAVLYDIIQYGVPIVCFY